MVLANASRSIEKVATSAPTSFQDGNGFFILSKSFDQAYRKESLLRFVEKHLIIPCGQSLSEVEGLLLEMGRLQLSFGKHLTADRYAELMW